MMATPRITGGSSMRSGAPAVARYNGECTSRDGDETSALVDDANLPDLSVPAYVDRGARRGHDSVLFRTNVIGVDLDADHRVPRRIDVDRARDRGNRLPER